MQEFGRLLNRYSSSEPEVADAIDTLLKKKLVVYDEDTNTLTVNMDIKLFFATQIYDLLRSLSMLRLFFLFCSCYFL